MHVSSIGLALIKKYEGFRDGAYLDAVGVPTIGYGTTIYSDGRLVRLGETISEGEAEAELKWECDQVADRLEEPLAQIALNQNQADALISFCYNLGVGALLSSTLLRNLKSGNFSGAADEFLRWNKATIKGVKTALSGLTTRRTEERALFLSASSGGRPLPPSTSPAEQVIKAVGYRDGQSNIVVALDDQDKIVEIIEMGNASPSSLSALFKTYPNVSDFEFAGPGDQVPAGPRTIFSGLPPPLATTLAPKLNSGLLLMGSEDDDDAPDHNVKQMQSRLTDLGYSLGSLDGIFGPLTDKAVRDFQSDFFGPQNADGLVGPLTWAKLWGDAPPPRPDPGRAAVGDNFLKLTRSGARDPFGLEVLILAYYKDGQLAGSVNACSGQPRKQIFQIGKNSPQGSMEPLPEGKWSMSDIHWADGADNYSGKIWSDGLGPAKIELAYAGPGSTARAEIEIHIDWNRKKSPGTAGCVGLLNIADYKTMVGWLRESNPSSLYVDWDLGTCPTP